MRYQNIREEELKLKVAADYFWLHDCTRIIGNVDFCVQAHQAEPGLFERESLLWAEAKTGSSNLYHSLTQLVLTIGKACTVSGTGQNKAGTVIENKTYQRYKGIMGKASNELFTPFRAELEKFFWFRPIPSVM